MYHDSILAKAARRAAQENPAIKISAHNRYAEYQMKHDPTYAVLSILITLTRYTELLWETISRRRAGDKLRWRVVLSIEWFKAILRLTLVFHSKKPLLSPPMPEREFEPEDPDTPNSHEQQSTTWKMARSKTVLPATPLNAKEYLYTKVLKAEHVRSPMFLMRNVDSVKGNLAEVMAILRPVIYAYLAYRYRHNPRNWTPWIVGAAIEYSARQLLFDNYAETTPGGLRGLSELEHEELRRRGSSLWWWSVRGAAYQTITRPILNGIATRTEKIPLIGLFGAILSDYLYLLDNYHFSSSSL
jgi:peroxin-16